MSLINPLGIQTTAGRPAPPRRRSIAGELAEYGGKTLMGLGAAAGTKLIEAGMGRGSALQDALVSDRVKAQQAEAQRMDRLTALSPAVVAQTQARARLGAEAMGQGGQTERREMQEAGLLERLKLELADKERQDAFMNNLRSQQQVLNEWKTKNKGRGSGKRGRAIKNADRFQKLAFRYGGMADKAEAEGKLGQAKEYRDLQAKNSELALKFQAEAGLVQNEEGGFKVKPFPVEEPRRTTKPESEQDKLAAARRGKIEREMEGKSVAELEYSMALERLSKLPKPNEFANKTDPIFQQYDETLTEVEKLAEKVVEERRRKRKSAPSAGTDQQENSSSGEQKPPWVSQ